MFEKAVIRSSEWLFEHDVLNDLNEHQGLSASFLQFSFGDGVVIFVQGEQKSVVRPLR